MHLVFDTNVLIDGFSDDFSYQHRLIDAVLKNQVQAFVTPRILKEYRLILNRLINDPDYQSHIQEFLNKTKTVKPSPVDIQIDDTDDLKFIEAALAAQADLIITNDRHLLDIGEYQAIKIVTPAEAWTHLEENSGGGEWQSWVKGLGLTLFISASLFAPVYLKAQTSIEDQQVKDKKSAIAELDQKINELKNLRDDTSNQAEKYEYQLQIIEQEQKLAEKQLAATKSSLVDTSQRQKLTEQHIADLREELAYKRYQLRGLVRLLYQEDQTPALHIFLNTRSLSQVIADQKSLAELQNRSFQILKDLQATEESLISEQAKLEEQSEELVQLEKLTMAQTQELDQQAEVKADLLNTKQTELANYQQKIAAAQAARKEIEQDIFTLKNSGVKLTLTEAEDIAKYASQLTGVRSSLLMAVLKVESSLGTNIGSGKFPDDMHPKSREAFIRITDKLGLDPYTAPISRRVSYGWGGAMGPAQVMPATWETIETRLADILGKPLPDPYNLTDAFVANAVLLADRGAADPSLEYEAVNRYLAGPNWRRFTWYGDRVLAIAAEYEREGL